MMTDAWRGCGLQVGTTGSVTGIDCSASATELAEDNLSRLVESNKAFEEKAGPCSFQTHNVFMPAEDLQVCQ